MTDALDLEQIRAALAAATPGPWTTVRPSGNLQVVSVEDGWPIARILAGKIDARRADAELVANAPVWLAQLADEVERLRTLNGQLTRALHGEFVEEWANPGEAKS